MRSSMSENFLFTDLALCYKIKEKSDALQVKDYSRYNRTMFNPDARKQRHETVFPQDKKMAFPLGAELVTVSRQKEGIL